MLERGMNVERNLPLMEEKLSIGAPPPPSVLRLQFVFSLGSGFGRRSGFHQTVISQSGRELWQRTCGDKCGGV